jgi:hypothetical protein
VGISLDKGLQDRSLLLLLLLLLLLPFQMLPLAASDGSRAV